MEAVQILLKTQDLVDFVKLGGSLKFQANFLYYWTYRTKNGFKTE